MEPGLLFCKVFFSTKLLVTAPLLVTPSHNHFSSPFTFLLWVNGDTSGYPPTLAYPAEARQSNPGRRTYSMDRQNRFWHSPCSSCLKPTWRPSCASVTYMFQDLGHVYVCCLRATRVQDIWLCWPSYGVPTTFEAQNLSSYSSVRFTKLHPLFGCGCLHLSELLGGASQKTTKLDSCLQV